MKNLRFIILLFFVFLIELSCKKSGINNNGSGNNNPPPDSSVIVPKDPDVANTIGFFLNDWTPKTFTAPSYIDTAIPSSANTIITIDASTVLTKVSPSIFGNNANPYMTQMINEPTLLDHIKNLHPKIIRFPGGNLSSVYWWNAVPDQYPADAPDTLLDADGNKIDPGYWYGKNTQSWTISLDNYYQMLQQTGNEGMITVNYSYARYGTSANPVAAAAHLAADWVRYDNGRTKYWEIGNESNGTWQAGYRIDLSNNKDGQPEIITGDLYGQHVKIFADSMRAAAQQTGATIYIGAQLLSDQPASYADATDKSWNSGVLAEAGTTADFFIVHDYYTPYETNSNAADIMASAATETKTMMDYVTQSTQAASVSLKPVALTEWNIFATGSQQMVSDIAGIHAVLVLGELLKNKIGEASRWDLANAWDNGDDQGIFNNGDEPGASKWNARPVFYYMYFFQQCIGDRFIPSAVSGGNGIMSYASTYSSGEVGITIVNTSTTGQNVHLTFKNFYAGKRFYWYTLTGGNDNGEFSRKVFVNGQAPSGISGGPDNYTTLKAYSATAQNGVFINIPARGVIYLVIDKK